MNSSQPPPNMPPDTLADRVADIIGAPRQPVRPMAPLPWYGKRAGLASHAEGLGIAPWGVYATPFAHTIAHTVVDLFANMAWGPRNTSWVPGDPASPFRLPRRWLPGFLGRPLDRIAGALDDGDLADPHDIVTAWWAPLWIAAALAGLVRPARLCWLGSDEIPPARWHRADWFAALWHAWRTLRATR